MLVIGAFLGTIGLIWGAGGFSGLQKENMAARVNNRIISLATYRQELQNKINFYRNVYGDRFSNNMIKNFRLEGKTLQELLQKEVLLEWAKSLGFQVTDDEVRKRIFSYAMFQQDGIFNANLYRQILRANRLTPAAFEQKQREELLLTKAQNLIADRVKVSEQELLLEYQRQNEKISTQYLVFDPQQYADQVTVEDDQLASYFEEHQEEYRVAEQRRVEYLWIDVESMGEVTPEEEEIEDYYYEHQDQYLIPAQVQASHILIKVSPDAEPEEDQKAKKKAQDIRQQLEAGADFAKLAAEFSEDKATAVKGGDVDIFPAAGWYPLLSRQLFPWVRAS
jgi:peptidyl-prolyl cis-trans isomerase D